MSFVFILFKKLVLIILNASLDGSDLTTYLAIYHTIVIADVTAEASVLALHKKTCSGMCLLHHLSLVAGINLTSTKLSSSSY